MSERRAEILKAVLMIAVISIEYYAMQPYHEPVIARAWDYLARACRWFAERAGRLALAAENNYYIAAQAGI